jgi:uncharacterized protein (TIGR04255 family)
VADFNPLTAPPPEEVFLKDAPLVRVIAQVRFPPILSIEKRDFLGSFQEAIREQYPILQQEQTQGFALSAEGFVPTTPQVTWRFLDGKNNWDWRVSLASDFIALETKTAYSSQSDFLNRLEKVLVALNESIKPSSVERFGIRYIDRIAGQNLQDISLLVKPQIAGMISAQFLSTDFNKYLQQTINESLFIIPDSKKQLFARWGIVPAGATFDPDALEPIDQLSWILDLDMSLSVSRDFDINALINEGQDFSDRIYAFFRWAVEEEFLRRFGGQP